ncbi:hypothetical protein IAU59_007592 [Kwoniella sp. CBS 9459]
MSENQTTNPADVLQACRDLIRTFTPTPTPTFPDVATGKAATRQAAIVLRGVMETMMSTWENSEQDRASRAELDKAQEDLREAEEKRKDDRARHLQDRKTLIQNNLNDLKAEKDREAEIEKSARDRATQIDTRITAMQQVLNGIQDEINKEDEDDH